MNKTFQDLGVEETILKAVAQEGYTEPTEIQQCAIPAILQGRDVIASAQTGTGKSAAFCLPILQLLAKAKSDEGYRGIRALILAPTRELAVQIEADFATYGKHSSLSQTAVFGGIPRKVQIDYLSREIDILVATPGRLLDLIERGHVDLSAIRHFVLDEVDTMLNLGFMDDVQRVINLLPKDRQTLLFSATIPPEISALAQAILKDPEKIVVSPKVKTAVGVRQELYWVGSDHKLFLLSYILKIKGIDSAFIFTSTKSSADKIAQTLSMQGFPAEAIHSDRTQRERGEVLERFKSREVRYLVATDVVARGIDIDGISHVINLELPQEPENYIHRIGRTARAGAEGVAITLCDPKHQDKIKQIEKLIDQKISIISTHPFMNSVRKFLLKK